MSFWDHIKPQQAKPTVVDVAMSPDRRELTLSWDDGVQSKVTARTLRQLCPCAACVDEWTNVRRHDPTKVPDTTTVEAMQQVGNYALAFQFSDSHSTGIYTWELLREIVSSGGAAQPTTS